MHQFLHKVFLLQKCYYFHFLFLRSQIRAMKKRNPEEVHDGFPTNGTKYETKGPNYRHENLKNKELQKEVERLKKLLEKVKCDEIY